MPGTKHSESATLAARVSVNGSSEGLSSALEGPEQHEQGVDDRQRERLRQREELLSFLTESDGTALDTMEFAQVAHAVDADTSTTFLTPALQRDAAVGAARRQQKEAAAAAVAAAKAALNAWEDGGAPEDLASVREMIKTCFNSEDYKEGRKAFTEKRAPAFKGR